MVSSLSEPRPSDPLMSGGPPSPKRFSNALIDIHGSYRSGRQAHEPPDELISDEVTPRVLRPHVVRSSFFFAASIFLLIGVLLCMFLSGVMAAFQTSSSLSGQEGGGGAEFFAVIALLLLLALMVLMMVWVVALFMPVNEPIAEYGLLIEGRAQAASVAYWWIGHTIAQRQAPFGVKLGRVQGKPAMLLAHRRIRGLIIVEAHGADLYMGWTMWRARSTVVIIGHLIRDTFNGAGTGSLRAAARVASGRAMRELIHSVTREGVQAAILEPPVADEVARAEVARLPDLDRPAAASSGQPGGSWPAASSPPTPQHQPYATVRQTTPPPPAHNHPGVPTANRDTRS